MSAGPLLAVSAGLQLFQGFQQYQAGKAQAKAASQTAAYNQQVAQQRSDVERQRLMREQSLFAGTQRVRAAASGATIGSFDDLFEDTAEQSLLDLAIFDYNSKVNQQQIQLQGDTESAYYKNQARSSLIEGVAGATSTGIQSYQAFKAPKAPSGTYQIGSNGGWSDYSPSWQAPPRKPRGSR